MTTVRFATFELLRRLDLTTLFGNPGSTEIPFLADFPEDMRFVLGLHEGSAVGMAAGYALATRRPAVVNLHTVAGLGNAVGALATARQAGASMVVIVGQQDRRHLALEPFLSGPLHGLAGDYPVWVDQPLRAQDVPGSVARAYHESIGPTPGPALVFVPMDDWDQDVDEPLVLPAPVQLRLASIADPAAVRDIGNRILSASRPAMVVGAGADDPATWAALVRLAEATGMPVWQEPFAGRAGFPQDHRQFAGYLPPSRGGVRGALASHDVVLVVAAPVFRQYPYESGALLPDGVTILQVTGNAAEANRSVAHLSLIAPVADFCSALADLVDLQDRPTHAHSKDGNRETVPVDAPAQPRHGGPLEAVHVFGALADRLTPDVVIVEESPSNGPLLRSMILARTSGSRFSAAGGGLGFAMPAAIGMRMAAPDRPVVCIIGDGSSLYSVQALWSAAQYAAGVVFVVLANGRYEIMDQLVNRHRAGATGPWHSFQDISVHQIAAGLGCPSLRVETYDGLIHVLDELLPTLANRTEPLVLEVAVASEG